jgi:hypothetical protein
MGAAVLGVGGALRRRRRDPDPLQRGAALGLLGFLLHGAWDVALLLPATLWTAAAVAGVLAGPPVARSWAEETGRSSAWRLALAATVLSLCGLGAASAAAAWRLEAAQAVLAAGDAAEALTQVRRGESWARWRADLPLLTAEILLHHPELAPSPAAARELAAAAASRALARNRCWPAAHAVRARVLLAGGDPGAAAADLSRAADLYPLAESYRRQLDALAAGVVRWRQTEGAP